MKIYTRTGDDGTTGPRRRARGAKHDARVEAYGSVDELNAALGVAHALDPERWFGELVPGLQAALFQVGAELATTDLPLLARLARGSDDDVAGIEREIDRLEADLAPLTRFVLPRGTPLPASLHHPRPACRRGARRGAARPRAPPRSTTRARCAGGPSGGSPRSRRARRSAPGSSTGSTGWRICCS